jgi:hypothetical protein
MPPKTWPLEERIQHYLVMALKSTVAVAIGLALVAGNWTIFFLSILTLILMFLPEFIESRVRIKLPIEFDLVLVLFVYAAFFVGSAGGAYERFWWWDAVLHTGSGFILGFAGFLLLYVKVLQKKVQASPRLVGLIIFSFGLAFGAVWEIFEYAVDSGFNTNMQRSGLQDTMWDLIVDGIGALVMAYIGVRYLENPHQGFIAKWIKKFLKINPGL